MSSVPVRPTEAGAARRLAVAGLLERSGGVLECSVRGRSMTPTLPAGSVVRILPGRSAPFAPGDVVAVAVRDRIITHRVVRGEDGSGHLLTRGDAAVAPDPPVAAAWVLGRVESARVNGRWGPVGPEPRRSGLRAAAAPALLGLMALLMWIHVVLADRAGHLLARLEPGRDRRPDHPAEDGNP